MYLSNLDNFIGLRLTDEQYNHLKAQAELYNMTVSQYIRAIIEADINLRRVHNNEHK